MGSSKATTSDNDENFVVSIDKQTAEACFTLVNE